MAPVRGISNIDDWGTLDTKPRTWTCQRASRGSKCGYSNASRSRKCGSCGKPKPARRRAKHLAALDLSYEQYIELNGGEHCGICRRGPSARRRLDRDHEHKGSGKPRGLLCSRCNRALPSWVTDAWLQSARLYLLRDAADKLYGGTA